MNDLLLKGMKGSRVIYRYLSGLAPEIRVEFPQNSKHIHSRDDRVDRLLSDLRIWEGSQKFGKFLTIFFIDFQRDTCNNISFNTISGLNIDIRYSSPKYIKITYLIGRVVNRTKNHRCQDSTSYCRIHEKNLLRKR
jgi:hypothetical protein